MSETYNYATGAVHHDHHRSITINGASGRDLQALLKSFWADEAEELTIDDASCASPEAPLTDAALVRAVEATQAYFWAQSSWAVVYCVCRDRMGVAANVSEFERRVQALPLKRGVIECHPRTIQKTLDTNAYMAYPVDTWAKHGAKERVMLLAERLVAELGRE